jgi:hypothetical protein
MYSVTLHDGVSYISPTVSQSITVYGVIDDAITVSHYNDRTDTKDYYLQPTGVTPVYADSAADNMCDVETCTSLTSFFDYVSSSTNPTPTDGNYFTFTCASATQPYRIFYTIDSTSPEPASPNTRVAKCGERVPYATLIPAYPKLHTLTSMIVSINYIASTFNYTNPVDTNEFGSYLVDTEAVGDRFRVVWPRFEDTVISASAAAAASAATVAPFRKKIKTGSSTRSVFGHAVTAHPSSLALLSPQSIEHGGCKINDVELLSTPMDSSHREGESMAAYYDTKRPTITLPKESYNSALTAQADELFGDMFGADEGGLCTVAINGGMFDTSNGNCLGSNVIGYARSGNKIVSTSGKSRNVVFGVLKDGGIRVGYIAKNDVAHTASAAAAATAPGADIQILTNSTDYDFLVTGCVWLVRAGVNYVAVSTQEDDMSIQTTGPQFSTVLSARSAIGHTEEGEIVVIQVDGKTWEFGVNLDEMAELCLEYGLVNCVNLDGGGSASIEYKGVLVNTPSYECEEGSIDRCAKPVGTVLCVVEEVDVDALPPKIICSDCDAAETNSPSPAADSGDDDSRTPTPAPPNDNNSKEADSTSSFVTLLLGVALAVSMYFNCRTYVRFNENIKYKDITPKAQTMNPMQNGSVEMVSPKFNGDYSDGDDDDDDDEEYWNRNNVFSPSGMDDDEESNPFSSPSLLKAHRPR